MRMVGRMKTCAAQVTEWDLSLHCILKLMVLLPDSSLQYFAKATAEPIDLPQ